MTDSWLDLARTVLVPARPDLARCLAARDEHLSARKVVAEARARAIANCEREIVLAREAVFAANDGVVAMRMTVLEREWRRLSRRDADAGMMDLWSRIAPASWIDHKRWRDSPPATNVDAAVALAADVAGVEAAEAAVRELRGALEAWGTPLGSRIRWRAVAQDAGCTTELLAEPLRAACERMAGLDIEQVAVRRAHEHEQRVHEAILARLPERPLLARSVAHAAFVDDLLRAASLDEKPTPMASLGSLWKTGYVISSIDASGVTLEIPNA